MRYFEFPPGATYRFGDTYVTMVAVFYTPPEDWDLRNKSERRNAGSIVIRLQFHGKSILFAGDAVGRHIGDPADALIATEKFLVDNAAVIPIDSDVLIVPHHGADNGSSTAFIQHVSPTWVIFSAGHEYAHPRATMAQRYLANGVAPTHLLRTDWGDDEGTAEWSAGRQAGHTDAAGDDDIDILIRPSGEVVVAYRNSP